jgi:hypothetical protein
VRVGEQQRWWPPAPRAATLRAAGTTPGEGADGLCHGRGGEGAGPTAWLEGAALAGVGDADRWEHSAGREDGGGRGRKIKRRDPVATRRANERQVWEEF